MLQIWFGKWLPFSQQWRLCDSLCPLTFFTQPPGLHRLFLILRPTCFSRVPCFSAHRSRWAGVSSYCPLSTARGIRELAWSKANALSLEFMLGRFCSSRQKNLGEPVYRSKPASLQAMVLNRLRCWLMWFSSMWMAECGCDPGNLLKVWRSPI